MDLERELEEIKVAKAELIEKLNEKFVELNDKEIKIRVGIHLFSVGGLG